MIPGGQAYQIAGHILESQTWTALSAHTPLACFYLVALRGHPFGPAYETAALKN